MAKIVNLRQARKRKHRGEKERIANENRRAHGRPAVEDVATRLAQTLNDKRLDAHRREPSDGGERR